MHLVLPQLTMETEWNTEENFLFVSAGRAPSFAWLNDVCDEKYIWCIDHGLDTCFMAQIYPDFFIGDNDSASDKSFAWAQEFSVPYELFPPEKDETDTQLALKKLKIDYENPFVLLTGAFGGRFDHAFSTIHSFANSNIKGVLADEKEFLTPIRDKDTLYLTFHKKPLAISLLPLSEKCTGVSTEGVKWELKNSTLLAKSPYAISNELLGKKLIISIKTGILGVYACWK